MPINLENLLDFAGHFAPGAAQVYAGHQRGKIDGEQAYEAAQEKKRQEERQARIDQQQEAVRALQLETGRENLNRIRNPEPWNPDADPQVLRERTLADERLGVYREQPERAGPTIGYGTDDWQEYLNRVAQLEAIRGGKSAEELPTFNTHFDEVSDDPRFMDLPVDRRTDVTREIRRGTPAEHLRPFPQMGTAGRDMTPAELAGTAASSATRPSMPATAAAPPKQMITADQAEFLRVVKGLSDADIQAQYTVR